MEVGPLDLSASDDIPSADSLPIARWYQVEALEIAIKENTIAFLDTGSGKTLIAIMLLRSYAYFIRKPSPLFAVFLVPQVVLVSQQAEALERHTDLKVGRYWGEMGIDFWDADTWKQEIDKHEVLVMTPQILLNCLRHSFLKLNMIKVLVFDECHHASGKHPYACIMTEFYHRQLKSGNHNLPRIFGMTASPVKSKGARSEELYWKEIHDLESLLKAKVYTCSRDELSSFVPFSTPKFRFYKHVDIPFAIHETFEGKLNSLKSLHECALKKLNVNKPAEESAIRKLQKIHTTLMYCLDHLGVWLALKAAEFLSSSETGLLPWEILDTSIEKIANRFCFDAFQALEDYVNAGPKWSIGCDVKAGLDSYLLSTKIVCLIELLLEYSHLKDMRCIVFVQRIISAVAIQSLLSEVLPKHCNWKSKYIAGNNLGLQTQTKKAQNGIVEEFSRGNVNIIVATSILEEGVDVQSCNLVIRFDPSVTVCSFIQSGGRARKQNSDYVLMLNSDDSSTHSRLKNYLISGEIMRKEALQHASQPCSPLNIELSADEFYSIESTEAIVTLNSSIFLIYFYCSRLPSDGYFKPAPRFVMEKEMNTCTLYLPKSCPIQKICVQGDVKTLKQKTCLEACKQLHKIGALTDNLVPDILAEEATIQEIGKEHYDDEQPIYFPPELVNADSFQPSKKIYSCYLVRLDRKFDYDIPVHDFVLVLETKLECDILNMEFDLEVDRGLLVVKLEYLGELKSLNDERALMCRKFQTTILEVLVDQSMDKLKEVIKGFKSRNNVEIGYFLLPSIKSFSGHVIDWHSVASVLFSYEDAWEHNINCSMKGNARVVPTKNGLVCTCMLQNSLVYTPHNGKFYCIIGIFDQLNGKSLLKLRNGRNVSYKEYYEKKYSVKLQHDEEFLLKARHIFPLQNYRGCTQEKRKESTKAFVELPPELCCILMSPVSISMLYSFTFVPAIMHRLESFLLAMNLKMHLDHCTQNVIIPTMKVLEAITTKKCQEKFHLESLETLGDSFLKYATCQQLFKTHQSYHEGLLSVKKDKIISNAALCNLGCNRKLPGFIRNEVFDAKNWKMPGSSCGSFSLEEQMLSSERKIYIKGTRKLKGKTVADVVEALVGAYVSTGGEKAGLLFLDWVGIKVDFMTISISRHFSVQPEKYVNVHRLESILKYSFKDPSLLLEALTHGSYMIPEIPRCYQRLEFLGDSVLDFLITLHLYNTYPGMSPGLLTDMRSASVNNDCYAQATLRQGLHKDILHASHDLHKHIAETIKSFNEFSSGTTFGWESESSFPKVLGDVIESLAGAIFVDSGFKKDVVFQSIRPLLEPLITPETLKFHPIRELHEVCQKHNFVNVKPAISRSNGSTTVTVEVSAKDETFRHTSTAHDKKTAQRIASKEVLKALKERFSRNGGFTEANPKKSSTSPAKRSKKR